MSSQFFIALSVIFASLLSIVLSFRYFVHYYNLAMNHSLQHQENRRWYWISGFILVMSGLVLISALSYLVYHSDGASLVKATPTTTATPSLQQDQPAEMLIAPPPPALTTTLTTALPATLLTQTAELEARFAQVGNTGGAGVNVRGNPGLSSTIIALVPDESRVTLMEDMQEVDGYTWQRVILADGRQGWIAVNFLIPQE